MIEATEIFPVYAVELGDVIKTKYGNLIVEDIDDYILRHSHHHHRCKRVGHRM